MEITLPDGCNIFYGSYVDNYNGNTRTRYYLNDGELVQNSRQSYTYDPRPSGYSCISSITYHSEYGIYFQFISFILCALCAVLIYRTIIKRLLP